MNSERAFSQGIESGWSRGPSAREACALTTMLPRSYHSRKHFNIQHSSEHRTCDIYYFGHTFCAHSTFHGLILLLSILLKIRFNIQSTLYFMLLSHPRHSMLLIYLITIIEESRLAYFVSKHSMTKEKVFYQ